MSKLKCTETVPKYGIDVPIQRLQGNMSYNLEDAYRAHYDFKALGRTKPGPLTEVLQNFFAFFEVGGASGKTEPVAGALKLWLDATNRMPKGHVLYFPFNQAKMDGANVWAVFWKK